MPMDSCGPLMRVVNINYRGFFLTFIWSYFYERSFVVLGGACGPVTHQNLGTQPALGYNTAMFLDDTNTLFPSPWEPLTEPSPPTDSLSFGEAEFENTFISRDGSSTTAAVTDQGEGAGSIQFPIFGTGLNGIIGCYGTNIGDPDGVIGVLKDPLIQPPFENTAETIDFSWPNIRVRNTETGAEWENNQWSVNGTFLSITLQVTFDSRNQ